MKSFPLFRCSFWVLIAALALVAAPALAQQSVPTFTKAFNPSTIGPGSVTTLRFTIVNSTGLPVRNLDFTDNLPAGMTIADPAKAGTTCQAGSLNAPAGGTTISYSGGGVGVGATCTVSVSVTTGVVGTSTNVSGDLTSDAGNSGSATADLIVATDRPGFRKAFSPASIFFGDLSRLTFTIDNTANASAAASLTFTDSLPVGMVIASPPGVTKSCANTAVSAPAGGSVISVAPSPFGQTAVAAGASCTIAVNVRGQAVGELGNTSGELMSSPMFGASRSSGRAAATLTVAREQISLTKAFVDDPVPPGGTVVLRFSVRNIDRDFVATDISFSDNLEAVLSGLVAVGLPADDVCGDGSQVSGTGVVTLTGGTLSPDVACTFDVTLQVPSTAASGSYTNVTSEVSADFDGSTVIGDPASDLLFVEPSPLLTKSFVDDPVGAGGSVTLMFTLKNTSLDAAAEDLAFEDIFDVILQTASVVPADGSCGAGSDFTFVPLSNPPGGSTNPARLILTGGTLAAGESCTFSITLHVAVAAAGGIYPNTTSEVTGTVGGEEVSGNPASDDLIVVSAPDLRKEFIDDPVNPGDTVTLQFSLEHDETAAGDATGITFTDDLDAALTGLVASGLPLAGVCGAGSSLSGIQTLLLTGGNLAPGESCTFNVSLTVPATATAGAHSNVTSAVSATILGTSAMSRPADDDLLIGGLTLSKEFVDDPTLPGGEVTLRFTIHNDSPFAATLIAFADDLDDGLSGLAASPSSLPLEDVCGAGSSLTGSSLNRQLSFQGGSLLGGESCTFDVKLVVPATAEAGLYFNTTTLFRATIDGQVTLFENGNDELEVASDFLVLTKEFTDDPVSPGGTVNLQFTVTNIHPTDTADAIMFTDDLEAALAGLVSTSGTLANVCGAGSELSGTSELTLTGGILAAGETCTFDVSLAVPATVSLGTTATNTTSVVMGKLGLLDVRGPAASDELQIDFLKFTKSFGSAVFPGDIVTLTFKITNLNGEDGVANLEFSDDLAGVLFGLEAIGLPAEGVCGEGSVLDGTSFLTLSEANLLPDGSCTFSVDLQVPEDAAAGSYLNVTSNLSRAGFAVGAPATATLVVLEPVVDDDGDGVLNGDDFCPNTVIPESVPTVSLKPNRYALVDDDTIFDTVVPNGGGPGDVFTTTDTAGCSCEQIIEEVGLGNGHKKHGCSIGAMRNWVNFVSGSENSPRRR